MSNNKYDPQCESVYPTLAVPNLSETIAFYEQKLDFELQFVWGEPPEHAGLCFGNAVIHFNAHSADLEKVADGFWLYFQVDDVDMLFERYRDRGVAIAGGQPVDQPWGMRELAISDLNGIRLRFGQPSLTSGDPIPIQRVTVEARIEKRMAALLADLAAAKQTTLGQTLEEILMHSFEPLPGMAGQGVASPHNRRMIEQIAELKRVHGIDYDTHDVYRFEES